MSIKDKLTSQSTMIHVMMITIFAVITMVYFSPVFFDGKVLDQHDTKQFKGSSKELADYRNATGEEALWTNRVFSGMPATLISEKFGANFTRELHRPLLLGMPHPFRYLFGAMLAAYVMFCAFKVNPFFGAAGAVGYAFTSFVLISLMAGHNTKVGAMADMPWLIAGVVLLYQHKYILGFVLTALGTTLELRHGHYQITFYLGLILIFYGISELVGHIKSGKIKEFAIASGIALVAAFVGLGPNLGRLMAVQDYAQYSTRGSSELKAVKEGGNADSGLTREYVFDWSQGTWENITFLVPGAFGGGSGESVREDSDLYNYFKSRGAKMSDLKLPYYHGDQRFTAGPIYIGAILCFLFVLGLLIIEDKYRWWLLWTALFAIMISMGKNLPSLNYFLYDHIPGFSKFRTVSMAVAMAAIPIVIGAGLALQKIFTLEFDKKLQQKLLIAFGITGGLALFMAVFAGMFNFYSPAEQSMKAPQYVSADWFDMLLDERKSVLRADAFRSFVFIALAFGAIYAGKKKTISVTVAGVIITALVLIDGWGVDKRYLNNDMFVAERRSNGPSPSKADRLILADSDIHYKVYNLQGGFNDGETSYWHNSIGGYHGAKLRRYQDLIDHHLSTETQSVVKGLQSGQLRALSSPCLNMLNTKYLKWGGSEKDFIANPNALGHAWFVDEVKTVQTADEEINAMKAKGWDPSKLAVVDGSKFKLGDVASAGADADIKLTSYGPKDMVYEANSPNGGLAVFSEVYYPDWTVKIDGKEASLARVNYVLRAVEIPAGKHNVTMEFISPAYESGQTMAGTFSIVFYVLVLGGLGWYVKTELLGTGTSTAVDESKKDEDGLEL